MDSPGHGGGGRQSQARCRGRNPGVHTPSATGGERRQSLFVLGLLRLGERLPVLAWGMTRGGAGGAREKGLQREVSVGQGQGVCNMGLGTRGMRGKGRGGSGRAIGLGSGPGPGPGPGPGKQGLGYG